MRPLRPLALVVAVFCGLFAGPVGAGEIRGRALLAGPPPPVKKVPVTNDQYVCGTAKDADDLVISAAREIMNVVVWLQNPPPTPPPATTVPPMQLDQKPPMQLDQKSCSFTPRVLLVGPGGTVDFLNSDRLLHNIHSRSTSNPSFNRTQPKGRTIPVKFSSPEFIRIDCDLHSWMRAWVVVTTHPYYAISDARGEFRLGGVPPGEYTLATWHETLRPTTRTIRVGDAPTEVTVELQLP